MLLSVQIPYLKPTKNSYLEKSNSKILFETYRASPRPLGNALPYLNAAFLADVSLSDSGVIINSIRLAFGAFGVKHAIRATSVEKYLVGKLLSVGLIYEVLKLITGDVSPEDGTSHPAYRSSLAVSFLFEFLFPLVDASVSNIDNYILKPTYDSSGIGNHCERTTLLSSAKQVIETSHEYDPVGEPIIKSGAAIQASGLFIYPLFITSYFVDNYIKI